MSYGYYRFNPDPIYQNYRRPPPSKYLSSNDDPNTNDPNTPFIPDIFYASRTGDLASVQEFVNANPKSVKSVDRYGSILTSTPNNRYRKSSTLLRVFMWASSSRTIFVTIWRSNQSERYRRPTILFGVFN